MPLPAPPVPAAPITPSPPAAPTSTAAVDSAAAAGVKNVDAAWAILTDPFRIEDAEALARGLEGLGIRSAEDLEVMDMCELELLMPSLKVVGRKLFRKAMGAPP